eukprot:Awhi_evm1s11772
MYAVHVLGHVKFMEELIRLKKVASNFTSLFVSTEGARGTPHFGMKSPEFSQPYEDDVAAHVSGDSDDELGERYSYSYAKAIGSLYMAKMARLQPQFRFLSTSPGMTLGTELTKLDNPIANFFGQYLLLPFFYYTGNGHYVDFGAKRYLDCLKGEGDFKNGHFYASAQGQMSGPLVDQSTFAP